MAPYPTTVAGLLAQLDAAGDDLGGYAGALYALVQSSRPVPVGSIPDRKKKGGTVPILGYRPPINRAVNRLADHLWGIAVGLPELRRDLRVQASTPAPDPRPLYLPDPVQPGFFDILTGEPPADPQNFSGVSWWPRLPENAIAAGCTRLTDVPPEDLVLGDPFHALSGWSHTMEEVQGRLIGWEGITVRSGGSIAQRHYGRYVRTARGRYRDLYAFLEPLGDILAARFGAQLSSLTAALGAILSDQGVPVPTLTGSSAVVSTLATRIRDAITAGHGGRLVVNESETAMAWAPGLPTSLLTYLAPQFVEGRRTTVVTARDSATPVPPGGTAEGAAKPDAIVFDSEEVNLTKYAGTALITVESAQFVRGIEPAVANVISAQIVRAIEADAVAAMQAGAGVTVTDAADITDGVLAAIAQLRAGGAAPNAVALSVNDWVAVMKVTGAGGYLNFSNPEQGPAGTWLGLAPCIVPSLADGSAVVVDGRSAPIGEPQGQPLCLVDPFSQGRNNKISIIIESWAVPMVTSPGGVATVTVAATP